MRLPAPRAWGPPALLLVLALALLRGAVAGGVLYERDIHLLFIPQVEVLVRSVTGGAWPLWNPSAGFGEPLLANGDAQVLYPFTWLNLVCPPGPYYTLFALAHLVLAGWGTRALARSLKLDPVAALTSGALFMASGPLPSLMSVQSHFASACWMPWVLSAALVTLRTRRTPAALAWGAAAAMQVLAGSADMVAATLLLTAGLWALHLWRCPADRGRVPRLASLGALALGLGLTISAAQWVPTLDLGRRTARWAGLADQARQFWSVHPALLAEWVAPVFPHELPLQPAAREALFEGRDPFLRSLYAGLPAAGLFVAALAHRLRRPLVLGLLLAVAVCAVLALGRHAPFLALATRVLPPLGAFRYPVKAMVPAALLWSLLAGVGVDAWRRGVLRARRARLFVATTAAVLLAAIAGVAWSPPGGLSAAFAEGHAIGPVLLRSVAPSLLFLAGVTALALRTGPQGGRRIAVAAAALAVADLAIVHRDLVPVAPAELLSPPPLARLLKVAGVERVYVYDYYSIAGKAREHLGLDVAHAVARRPEGFDPRAALALALHQYLYPPVPSEYGFDGSYDMDIRLVHPAFRVDMAQLLRAVEGTPVHLRLLRMAAVDAVVALHEPGFEDLAPLGTVPSLGPLPVRAYRVPDRLPRTFVVGGSRRADGLDALRLVIGPSFDPLRTVVLADGPEREAPSTFAGASRILARRADRVTLEANLSHDGFVVLSDAWEQGWRAWLDGRPVPVHRANVAFRAVEVPAGAHVIELRYRPPAVLAGAIVSLLGLLAGAWMWLRFRARPRPWADLP